MPLDAGSGGEGGRAPSLNVLGGKLEACSIKPMTGFYRNGCCDTGTEDIGSHTVCILATAEFLEFSKSRGNDLSTPMKAFGFAGLKPGDRWCLCAPRWQEALEAGRAPRVVLRASHQGALDYCSLADLKKHAIDLA
jgi:uncharacterized protein